MTSELISEFDQVQLSAHLLANQLVDAASMINAQGQFPPTDLADNVNTHLEQEKQFRLQLEQAAQRSHLELSDDLLQVPFAQLKTILDATVTLKQAKLHLEDLRNQLDESACDQQAKRALYADLTAFENLIHQSKLPLSDETILFSEKKDKLTSKVEQLLQAPVIEIPPAVIEPPAKLETPSAEPDLKQSSPIIDRPAESDSATADQTVAEDLIFDDIKSNSAAKQIITATEIQAQLEAEAQTGSTPAKEKVADQHVSPDSVFDEFGPPGQEIKESLTEQVRKELLRTGLKTDTSHSPSSIPVLPDTQSPLVVPGADYSQVQEYAKLAADSQNRFDRVSYLARLTWELISLGQYAWAYQVSRCLHFKVDDDLTIPAPPAWLISLLSMGDHVRLSSGRISREFNAIAAKYHDEAIHIARSPNSPEALLLRAAIMRGTVTTASNLTADLLRSYSIEPSQTQVYNYCTRIASFASRASGLKLDQYFYRPGAALVKADARMIRAQVIDWQDRVLEKILPYRVTTPLFARAHWTAKTTQSLKYPDLISQWRARQTLQAQMIRLLQPIVENQLTHGAAIELELRRLSDSVLLTETGTLAILDVTDTVEIPGREVYHYVQEAIEFASRWLVLSASYPDMESILVPQEVNELRDEIDRRQNAVFLELKQLEKNHASQAHRAALTACRRSMDRIHQLFHPTREPQIAERDHLCLLNAELLKIPGVTVDEDWKCNISPSTLETQILSALSQGEITWEQAFSQQLQTGCYRSAHQLLKLDLWSDEQKTELNQQLESRRKQSSGFLHDLANQIRTKIEESQQLDILSSSEAEKLTTQISSIEQRIPTEYRLDLLRSNLNQLWQHLETKKELELRKMQERMSRLSGDQPIPDRSSSSNSEQMQPPRSQTESDDEDSEDWAIDV